MSVILVGIFVALTYYLFENLVHHAIDIVWYDWFNTDENRLLVVPLAGVFGLTFFGLQHFLDPKSEGKDEAGLGDMPKPTLANFSKVLLIGFFSLLAGAALGPEAILVPASMIAGGLVAKRFTVGQKANTKLLAAAGIMALFTAFFNSFFVGVLSLLLAVKETKIKASSFTGLVAVLASGASFLTLKAVAGEAYVETPKYSWALSLDTVLLCGLLAVAGYLTILLMSTIHDKFETTRKVANQTPWWQHGLIASSVLAGLYLLGGNLVEFTGNLSIVPMFEAAAGLGLAGLIWLLVVKVGLISWSKVIGYRGGMIFPTIFLAAVLVAIAQLYVPELNLIYGIISVLVGAFAANRKSHILV